MKLLVVTPYFYPKIGGLENYAYNFCIGLKKKYRWNIIVITSNHKDKKNIVETIDDLKIYRLAPLFKLSNTPIHPLWYWEIRNIIKKENPDIINAHTPVPFIADIAALAAKKIPLLVTYHALSLYKQGFTPFNAVIGLYKLFERSLFKKANDIIIVSNVIKQAIPNKFSNKITVIYNSIPQNDLPKTNKIKKEGKINVLFISSLDKTHDWKGLDDLLLAVKMYYEKINKEIVLHIVGEGNDKKRYKQLANDYGIIKNVKFHGKKFGENKKELLENATLGVIYPKSSNDAFPTVALEYWAYSLPIIASNITPINKIIKDKKTAYLVQPKNPEALAEGIKKLISNQNLAQKISKGGYNELKRKYILENEIKKFYSLTKGYTL